MRKILFPSILLCFCVAIVKAQGLYFKHLGITDGVSQVRVSSIYQDELGAVWLGTSEGLNRYNGRDIKAFRPSLSDKGLTNNEISKLCGDKQGRMYIRSGNDLIKYDINEERFTCLRKNDVGGIFCKGDTLWAVCESGIYYSVAGNPDLTFVTSLIGGKSRCADLYVDDATIWICNYTELIAISRKNLVQQSVLLTFSRGECVSGDSAENIWVGTWDGLYRIAPINRGITHYTSTSESANLSDNQVRCVLEDDFKRVWFGTFRGLDSYDLTTGEWSHYTRYGDSSNTLSHHSVLCLHKDMQGNIWVGTYYGGANVFNPDKKCSLFYCAEPFYEGSLSFPVVGKMTEDGKGNVWICTEGGGLNRYNKGTGIFARYQHQKGDAGSVGSNNLKSIYYCKENDNLYVGTHLGGLYILDLKSNKGHSLHHIKGDSTSLPHEIVNDIQKYKDGLALLTQGGPVFLNLSTEKFSPLSADTAIQKLLRREYAFETFLIDSKQRMWLSLSAGGVLCVDLLTSKVTSYVSDANDASSIGKFKVVHIFEDSRGSVYFCTIGSGLFEYKERERVFKSYGSFNHCLPSDYCYYIGESAEDHNLFVLHGKGLSVFNKEKGKAENTCHLFEQTYGQGSALFQDKDGTLFISGTNGLALLQKQDWNSSSVKSSLAFDKLFVLNKEVLPNDDTGILTNILARTSDVYLHPQQNNIVVEFAVFNYDNNHNRLFEYRLDGIDKGWNSISGTTITYTNLPSGDYTLRVRPSNAAEEEISLKIHIATPFYATVWAYLFYFLFLLGVMMLFVRFRTRQAVLESSLEFERKEKERIEELNQVKLRFFTNISHEFRTPLTLILGQIEILMQMELSTIVHNRISRIYKNAWHLRNLISELLDFRKQEQGYLKLKVEEQNLVDFTRQIYLCFYEYAQKKGINYRFNYVEENLPVWFDVKQLQKVIFNLLSNAFKYTPDKGSITVEVREIASQAVISVSDTGAGIPAEQLSKIFERFYQTDISSSSSTLGTGIGLALAKGIIDMHHGKIEVESVMEKGTKFTLSLPLGNRHFTEEEIVVARGRESVIMPEVVQVPFFEQRETDKSEEIVLSGNSEEEGKPIVFLIDDSEELLSMLEDVFLPMYIVRVAHDGNEGWKMVQQTCPDLVVSDVMMPGMSGTELCNKIKMSVEFSHIPVVLLTAQSSDENRVKGLKFGADDYVVKPFDIKLLLVRCGNLIKNKKRLAAHYTGRPASESPVMEAVNERDKELLTKCVSIIRQNFDNSDFDVNMLASQLCVGRSKLYVQFKSMVGLTPNEFILKVKLDEAMSLLKEHPEFNISEIAIRLGFSSPRYFSKSFKAFFGVTPQAVRTPKTE